MLLISSSYLRMKPNGLIDLIGRYPLIISVPSEEYILCPIPRDNTYKLMVSIKETVRHTTLLRITSDEGIILFLCYLIYRNY